MPKVKYDVSNVDDAGGFEHVQPGMYIGKISEINLRDSKSGNGPMLEVILQPYKTADGKAVKPKDKKKQVGRVYTYVLLEHEPSDWKLKEFTKAVGLKDKGMIDTDKLVGTSVQMNLKPDTDLDDKYRPRVGKLMRMPDGAKSDASDGASATAVEPDDDEDETSEDAYTADDLELMDDDELIEAAAEFDIKKPTGRMTPVKTKKLIRAILEAQEEEADEEEADEEDEDEEEADEETTDEEATDEEDDEEDEEEEAEDEDEEDLEDTLGALDRKGLKEYIKDNDLEIKVVKSMEDEDIREAIMEVMAPEEEDEEEDEQEEATDYNSWSMDALKKEAQERGLSTKGSKKVLAGRLGKDDEDDDNPF